MSNDDLMSRIAAGDDSAFAELVLSQQPRLLRWLRRQSIAWETCEDLAQQTLLAVWTHAVSYSARGEFDAWLFSILSRKVRDWRRSECRRPMGHVESGYDPHRLAQNEDTAEQIVIRLDEAAICMGLVDTIPPAQREVLLRHAAGDWLPDIARDTGVSLGTVKGRLRCARKHVKGARNACKRKAAAAVRRGPVAAVLVSASAH